MHDKGYALQEGHRSTWWGVCMAEDGHPAGRSLNFAICDEVNRFCSH